ncbi:hypothetical protein LTR70_000930 [Exophiala xenobiotica]|nr:hypothetical protein LTR70_000930 [Exophiala xenobiotica]
MSPVIKDVTSASSDDNFMRTTVLTESILYTVSDTTSSSSALSSITLNRGFTVANPLSTTANLASQSTPPDEAVTSTALPDSLTIVTTTTDFTSWLETTGTDGLPTNVTAIVIRSTFYTTDTTALATAKSQAANSTASRPPQPSMARSAHEAVVEGTYNSAYYFSALYLPPLMAVLVKALWQALYAAIRLIEPFERMNNPGGTPMRYSLFAEYLSSSLSLDILGALGRGNLIPLVAGFSFVLLQIGTPLATIPMTVESADICMIDGQERRCDPRWVVNTALLRSVEAIAAACMLSIVVIAILIRRQKSGISSDPSSLASVATLLNHEHLLHDIQSVDPNSKHEAFEKAFDQHACWIGYHRNSEGLARYGIVGSQAPNGSTGHRTLLARGQDYQAVNNPAQSSSQVKSSSDSVWFLVTDILGLLVPLTLFAIIVAFWFDTRNDVLNEFFNSTTRWPKLVLVSLATISALLTSSIERVVRIVEPFRRLAANYSHDVTRPAPPETTLLIKRSGTAYSSLIRSAHLLALKELHGGRMSFQTLVALAAILADLSIIAVVGIAFSEAMVWKQYKISSFLGMALLGYVLMIWLVVLIWWRNNAVVKAVRSSKGAETIGGVMRYLVLGGKMNVEEAARLDVEWEQHRSLEKADRGWRGRRACFGLFERQKMLAE